MIIRKESINIPKNIKTFLNNPRISLNAKGLFFWILTQNDDFELNSKSIATYNKVSLNIIYNAIVELESLGYIKQESDSQATGESLIFYDTPQIEISTSYKEQEKQRRNADKATKNFIKKYLTPNKHFRRTSSIDTLLDSMRNPMYEVDWAYINNYINDYMTYEEFLLTEYWEIVSIYKKIHAGFTCKQCGKVSHIMSNLNIHHNTYEHHGQEHLQEVIDNDLECLCSECHENFHKTHQLFY